MAELVCVPPADVEKVWPIVGPMLRRAIERTGLSDFSECQSALFCGAHLLWLAIENKTIKGIATTQLVKANERKSCIIVACSGEDFREWLPLIGGIEKYATEEGCQSMRIFGRSGWSRVLDGYRSQFSILEKELS